MTTQADLDEAREEEFQQFLKEAERGEWDGILGGKVEVKVVEGRRVAWRVVPKEDA